jgi:hypothetical protein
LHEDGTVTAVDLTQVVDLLAKFSGNDLTATLSRLERSVRGLTALGTRRFLLEATATNEVFMAASEMKRLAGQINVVIHSLGILLCLPHLLEVGSKSKRFLSAQETPDASLILRPTTASLSSSSSIGAAAQRLGH